ncbi:MAG: beta-N-acetylhexosaminidase [Parvibaculaceae bacterium]|nr:beta-N-acetylhexosaminidase [Parvibaculaceae bacterium]
MQSSSISNAIFGCQGLELSGEEIAFFRDVKPWGFILFARNVDTPEQVRALTASMREVTGRDSTPILIDQEGGRVARLKPPHWRAYPEGRAYGKIFEADNDAGLEFAWLGARLIAQELIDVGVNVNCLPIMDLPVEGAHDVIGNRAYGRGEEIVVPIGRAVANGLLAGGVLPIIKHIPGHGRAGVDSHLELPRVTTSREELSATDFKPFAALKDIVMAMTAHVIYEAIDADAPATTSPKVIKDVLRGEIGYQGLIMTDDLSMKALGGTYASRVQASIGAGCDMILHCNGEMDQMQEIAGELKSLSGNSLKRAVAAEKALRTPEDIDLPASLARFAELCEKTA